MEKEYRFMESRSIETKKGHFEVFYLPEKTWNYLEFCMTKHLKVEDFINECRKTFNTSDTQTSLENFITQAAYCLYEKIGDCKKHDRVWPILTRSAIQKSKSIFEFRERLEKKRTTQDNKGTSQTK